MKKHKSEVNQEIAQRWAVFWSEHKDFDSSWARNLLHMLSEFLPFVFKRDAVRYGLKELYIRSGVQCPPDWNWSKDWSGAGYDLPTVALRDLPIFHLALALDAYAYYGLKLASEAQHESHDLDQFLEDIRETKAQKNPGVSLTLFPLEWSEKEMNQTINAALAREKLDFPEIGGMTADELAALVKRPRKNIVNLLAPNQGILKLDEQGLISIESARRWLERRPDFRPSVWQLQKTNTKVSAPHSGAFLENDLVFVPIANDGTWFSPNDRNKDDTQYYVASADQEKKFADYWLALEFLHRAKVPRWRYRDATKRWRLKTSGPDAWARKPRAEIETMLRAII